MVQIYGSNAPSFLMGHCLLSTLCVIEYQLEADKVGSSRNLVYPQKTKDLVEIRYY